MVTIRRSYAYSLGCKLGAAHNAIKRLRSRKILPLRHIQVDEVKYHEEIYFHKKPNAVDIYGRYYYSIHDAIHGICELDEYQMAEVDKIWFYKRLALTQLGTGYSSNNAGDGPPSICELLDIVRNNIKDKNTFRIMESVIFLVYDLQKCKCKSDIIIPVIRFARDHYDGVFLEDFINQIDICINKIFSEYQLQSDDDEHVFTKLRNYLDDYDIFRNSPLFKKVYKLIMYILAYTLFRDKNCTYESFGYTALEAAAFKSKYHIGPDFIYVILDTLTFLCEKGYQIYKEGYSSSIFHSTTRYKKFYNDCETIKNKARNLNQLEALDENAFLNDLETLISQGEDICKCSKSMGKFEADYIRRYVNDIQSIRLDILSYRGATRARKAPFSMLINGDSGIGKSSLIKIFIAHFCNVKSLENDDSYIYTRNFVEKYWNNFRTYMHTVILDDVSFRHPNLGDPSSVDEIIQIVNDINFVPDQADITDKGRIPFRCKLALATTNTKNLNAHHYFSCPSAVQRRFPYVITPSVKSQYKNVTTGMLDPTLVPILEENSYPDLWDFTVESVIPAPIKNGSRQNLAEFKIILKDVGMVEFMKWYVEAIRLHDANQENVNHAVEHIKRVTVCNCCYLPKANCNCLQSMNYEILNFMYCYAWVTFFQEGLYIIFVHLFATFGLSNYFSRLAWRFVSNPNFARIVFKRSAQQVERALGKPKYLAAITGSIALLTVIYKTYKYTQKDIQGSNQSKDVGYKPEPSINDTREAIWYKDVFELTTADVTRSTLSSKGMGFENIKSLLFKNCVQITIEINETSIRKSKAFGIGGQLYILNNHSVPSVGNLNVKVVQSCSKDGVNNNIVFTLSQSDIYREEDGDLCCIIIRCLPPKKNLTQYFCKDSFAANTHACYIAKGEGGEFIDRQVKNIKLQNNALIQPLSKRFDVWIGTSDEPTSNGDCGSILLARSELGYCIVGLHLLGNGNSVVSRSINSSFINRCISFGQKYFVGSNPPLLQSSNEDPKLVSLHKKSALRYIDNGNANVYGSFSGFRPQNKSRVEPTLISETIKLKYDYSTDCGRPIFNWKPWRIAALDSLNIPNNIDTQILDECSQQFAQDILKGLTKDDFAKIHIYDTFTSINGAEGVNYVDKIARNTSAGFPFKRSKKYYMYAVEAAHGLQDPVDVTDEIKEVYENMLDRYRNGDRAGCVFSAHLKDEPLAQKKIDAGKTRVFSGANLPWIMIVRKYFLSCVRVIQENQQLFESAPGIIAQCSEWEDLYKYLTAHGEHKIVAGDYSKYDKRMSAIFILSAFDILIKICEASGNYTEDDITILRGISYDTTFAFQDYNGDLVEFFGSNPSGHPLTVIINGLVNSLYQRYSYRLLNPENECKTFKDNVNLMTYGDDNIMGISDSVPWFNHTSISKALSTINVVYTMADKEAESVPYINIKDASFLKRTWRYDINTNTHLAQLEHKSIEKMLTIWVRSKSITPEEQMIAVITSANREYFFYGIDVYKEKQKMFYDLIKLHNLNEYVIDSTLPAYETLLNEYFTRSKLSDSIFKD